MTLRSDNSEIRCPDGVALCLGMVILLVGVFYYLLLRTDSPVFLSYFGFDRIPGLPAAMINGVSWLPTFVGWNQSSPTTQLKQANQVKYEAFGRLPANVSGIVPPAAAEKEGLGVERAAFGAALTEVNG